jgi:hypothetical protein
MGSEAGKRKAFPWEIFHHGIDQACMPLRREGPDVTGPCADFVTRQEFALALPAEQKGCLEC